MSEEITEREEFIKIVGILSFSDAHPSDCKYITNFIIDLAKENQQLKEDVKDLDNQKEMMFKNMQLNQLKVCELAKVLDEIKEYINKNSIYFATSEKVGNYFANCNCDDLLQILNKVEDLC